MDCLNGEQLNALCDGTIEELAADRLFEHIRNCPSCEDSLLAIEMRATDGFRRRILRAARSEPFCDEPQLTAALTLIREAPVASRRIDAFPFQLAKGLRLVDEISSGGVGTVFEAVEAQDEQRCAVKMLNADHLSRPARRRFEREIRLLQSLDHPHIVGIRRYGEWSGIPYLVTDYIDGENLATRVRHEGPLETATALRYALQAAKGLQHAHSRSIIHRDLTPTNLLVDADDMVRIVDLGLAKALNNDASDLAGVFDDLTPRGVGAGTRPYMSPEQLEGLSNADHRSDIYSLGATLCFLLTGSARGRGQLLGPPSGDQQNNRRGQFEGVPESVRAVLRRMLAEKPEARYESMDEVVEALTAVAKSL